jgi:hypothetical protein
MSMRLSPWQKVFVVFISFGIAVIGFMVKLPSSFRHIDKELHAVFYFLAAALLNFLFAGTNFIKHIVIFVLLFLFGTAIEYAQEYSNKILHRRIHGRFDPEDIQWNLKGLMAFSAVWIVYSLVALAFKKSSVKEAKN